VICLLALEVSDVFDTGRIGVRWLTWRELMEMMSSNGMAWHSIVVDVTAVR
jgi:hypothetical protein